MTAEAVWANMLDLYRVRVLEEQGVFPRGFALRSQIATALYIERVVWLKQRRDLPGAPPYPGPRQA